MTAPDLDPAGPPATRDRLVEAISAHGPITARQLAERFGLTSAAVRRHLAALEAEDVIAEHEMPVAHRGRGRPSKAFVLSKSAHDHLPGGYDELAVMAVEELARRGDEAVARLAERRVADWEAALAEAVAVREAAGEKVTISRKVELLAELLTSRGYATTVRPLHVPLPTPGARSGSSPRTLVTAQLCHGHCPVLDVAADHPELCEAETRVISRIIGAPVQRLATLAQGAHCCTTHIPLTEGRTS
ncbi:helix-turn-helix transcriptional regulator [Brachybacterium sacelli]|uniref:ArsR family transcriptional regulator n=1 Tax=Brachybacterium sacelli TaxID=173364 RepID=A0ABS4X2R1_9MICO|nr:winged helix-turn-helix transcriptional regulator [Brachybacterium sacelli]MBP2382661.1 putative ArsR family transcriptional regulator [Brachybacterium sacelli]